MDQAARGELIQLFLLQSDRTSFADLEETDIVFETPNLLV